jgi:AmiR/NasT family two-component response regulator
LTIEQAKGYLAGRDGTTIDAAFERLRAHARKHQLAIRDVSRLVLHGELFAEKPADPMP